MAKKGAKKTKSGSGKKPSSGKRPLQLRVAVLALAAIAIILLVLTLVYRTHEGASTTGATKQHLPPTETKTKEQETAASAPRTNRPVALSPPKKEALAPPPRTAMPVAVRHEEEYREVGPKKITPPPSVSRKPMAAIVVDDLGANLHFLQELIALDQPITAAILPNVPHSGESARLARDADLEIMLHIPMEPRNYPEVNPGEDALLIGLTPAEIRQRMEAYLAVVPQAVGGNNHMGSRFTEDNAGMASALAVLKARGLYFIDSRTSAASVAYDQARQLHLRTAERDLFLDNELTVAAIRERLRLLATTAVERGHAIGICHPHPETLAALKTELPRFKALGVVIVPASQLVSDRSAKPG